VGDGLVKAGQMAASSPRHGRIDRVVLVSDHQLTSVDPREANDVPAPSISLASRGRWRNDGTLEVTGDRSRPNVEFRYSGVSLSSPDNVTFRYRLERLDDHWVEPGTRRVAYYSRLPAGRYRFVVTAANRDGTWNPVEASMDVVVLAPLLLRPWFLALMLLALALSLWAHRAVLRTREHQSARAFATRA
jgi:hypothetical protein